jgi:hypothetical protein
MAEKHGMHVAQAHSNTRKCKGCEASGQGSPKNNEARKPQTTNKPRAQSKQLAAAPHEGRLTRVANRRHSRPPQGIPLHQGQDGTSGAQLPPTMSMITPGTQHQSVGSALSKPGLTHTKEAGTVPAKPSTKNTQPAPEGDTTALTHLYTLQRTHTLRQCGAHRFTSQHTPTRYP